MVIGAAYPFLVYALHERVSPSVFAIGACLLLFARAYFSSSGFMRLLRVPLLAAVAALGMLSIVDATLASRIYPALISLMFAALFGSTLRHPPSLVERMARVRDPDLSSAGQDYCRRLTWIWTVWLVTNAAIATLLSALHSIELWLLWTGLVSYVCSGVLFLGEMLIRDRLLAGNRQRGRDA
ncbi:MAG: hypothetical protein HYU58_13835 [Proteobacteria bacterium]|nr:hypothetical protein [Pseudomonadota bacterium]